MESVVQGKKYRWLLPEKITDQVPHLSARYNLSVPVIQTLVNRGLKTQESIERYLFTERERDVACPSLLKDAQKAVERIIRALDTGEKILIAGDYDVDGITSSAVMLFCLLPLGAHVNYFLPNRARDGYGLSVKTVERAAKNGYSVIITVDNGITAFEAAHKARELGLDLIITDHHRPHGELPQAYAIVNPHQQDCPYPFKHFAGVGVGFKLMSLLYQYKNMTLPDQVYELVLLGTVADVVPLRDENRFWVRQGLYSINNKKTASFAFEVLKRNGRVNKENIRAQDIGFFITPQINALGRLDDPRDGVKFLMCTDHQEVERIGAVLVQLNESRKLVERTIVQDIERLIEQRDMANEPIITAAHSEWPTGVIGLVASRLVSSYHKPTFLFHITPDGIAKGSCRSIPGFNIFEALDTLHDMLISYGGHAAAAGLSLPASDLEQFKERMGNLVAQRVAPEDRVPTVQIDALLPLREVTAKLLHDLAYLEPFGCENPSPLFYLKNVMLVGEPRFFKESHVKINVFSDGVIKSVIFFNRPELYSLVTEARELLCDLVVQVLENQWDGKTQVELQGIDMRVCHAP